MSSEWKNTWGTALNPNDPRNQPGYKDGLNQPVDFLKTFRQPIPGVNLIQILDAGTPPPIVGKAATAALKYGLLGAVGLTKMGIAAMLSGRGGEETALTTVDQIIKTGQQVRAEQPVDPLQFPNLTEGK